MDKKEIINLIEEKHSSLIDWLEKYGKNYWEYSPAGKWTTGQQIIHLTQSLKPLNKALLIPKIALKFKFGKANREPRPYDKVVERYHQRLKESEGVVSPFSNEMPNPTSAEMDDYILKFKKQVEKLTRTIIKKWSEKDLDTYILPHPLMGKMPIRELLMWTAYHAEHHMVSIVSRAQEKSKV